MVFSAASRGEEVTSSIRRSFADLMLWTVCAPFLGTDMRPDAEQSKEPPCLRQIKICARQVEKMMISYIHSHSVSQRRLYQEQALKKVKAARKGSGASLLGNFQDTQCLPPHPICQEQWRMIPF